MISQKMKGLIASAVAACSFAFGGSLAHAGIVTWNSFTGPGTTSFTQVGGVSTFTETLPNSPGGSSTWSNSGTVSGSGDYTVDYRLNGFFAFFNVTLNLSAQVNNVLRTAILAEGPASCGACNPPSGGFDYIGTYTFTGLTAGDTIGFTWSGNNRDSNRTKDSVLTLTEVNTQPVPEPMSLALLGLGLAGVAVSRRKKA